MHNGQGSGDTETGAYNLLGPTSGMIWANPGALYRLPTEDEWYKAAYYSGSGANYWLYPTRSDGAPGNELNGTPNQANQKFSAYATTPGNATYSRVQNYLTDVGAFAGSASYYGTFDQGGNVWERNDADFNGFSRGLRGGYWGNTEVVMQSLRRDGVAPTAEFSSIGFRLVAIPEPSRLSLLLTATLVFMWRRR
jgi:formylglycine-generating enzyme required for sulfatase activity